VYSDVVHMRKCACVCWGGKSLEFTCDRILFCTGTLGLVIRLLWFLTPYVTSKCHNVMPTTVTPTTAVGYPRNIVSLATPLQKLQT
jgi:hypothetical protein